MQRDAGRSFGLAPAFPPAARSYQAFTFYPALTYGVDGDRIDSANFRIIGVGNRGLSGIVYRIKVASVCSKQGRRNAWGARFGKIADAEFHARKIGGQQPISNRRDSQPVREPTDATAVDDCVGTPGDAVNHNARAVRAPAFSAGGGDRRHVYPQPELKATDCPGERVQPSFHERDHPRRVRIAALRDVGPGLKPALSSSCARLVREQL